MSPGRATRKASSVPAAPERQGCTFVVPGDPATATGGFVYDRRMIAALAAAGMLAGTIVLPDRFPRADAATLAAADRRLAALAPGATVIVDGLAFAPLAAVLRRHSRLRLLALIHHPLCDETGLTAAERASWFEAEREALTLARHVIVTSVATARRLADFGVGEHKVTVVRPGVRSGKSPTRRVVRPDRAKGGRPVRLLCVGSLVPRKGQDLLVRALAPLRWLNWHLTLVGPHRDRAYARRLCRLVRSLGLRRRIRIAGTVSDRILDALYRSADLFVLPSHHEGYGMAPAEAVAYGVPVVTTRAGAIAEAVPAAAARFVPTGNVPALSATLQRLIGNRAERLALQRAAAASAGMQPDWAGAEAAFVAAVGTIIGAP